MATLPTTPTGLELEDYIAAILQCGGLFIEKNIKAQEVENIFELDMVASAYTDMKPARHLLEIKSGQWGFPDIFKLRGWLDYLSLLGVPISTTSLVVTSNQKDRDLTFVKEEAAKLDIILRYISDVSKSGDHLADIIVNDTTNHISKVIWRFSFWTERCLLNVLRTSRKDSPCTEGAISAIEYYKLINDSIFFVNDPRLQITKIYRAYSDHPKLSLGLANEIEGNKFNPKDPEIKCRPFKEALNGSYDEIQACFYLEHRARLSILKCAVELLCLEKQGKLPKVDNDGSDLLDQIYGLLPKSFHSGIKYLQGSQSFVRYPHFWQVFLWNWGGIILNERKDAEYEQLSLETGVPLGEIERAFKCYENFFPTNWFVDLQNGIKIVKMVPTQFRGLGAFRRLRNAQADNYSELKVREEASDTLLMWHNSSAKLLESKYARA